MLGHHMSLQYFYVFIFAQSPDFLLQIRALLIVYDFPPVFRYDHYVVLTKPFSMGLTICLVCHSFSFCVAIDLSILLYHIRRFFGITFVAHPLSGWLSVSPSAQPPKALIKKSLVISFINNTEFPDRQFMLCKFKDLFLI